MRNKEKRDAITYEEVRHFFHYDPITGKLTNRIDRSRKAKAGVEVGYIDFDGYRMLKLRGYRAQAVYFIWLWMTGKWPDPEVDHKNGIRDDNRWENLREATRSQNCINKESYSKPNTLGFRGIKRQAKGRFAAAICVGQKEYFLGSFSCQEHAAIAYDVAAHKHHGEFARLNFPKSAGRDWLIV